MTARISTGPLKREISSRRYLSPLGQSLLLFINSRTGYVAADNLALNLCIRHFVNATYPYQTQVRLASSLSCLHRSLNTPSKH
jgi:hypothetical protein